MKRTAAFLVALVMALCMTVTCVAESWTCTCGTENTGNFCGECGLSKREAESAAIGQSFVLNLYSEEWFCSSCGIIGNKKFCTTCGKKRVEPIGNLVTFGNDSGSPLQWIVMDVKDNKALLSCRTVLEKRQFDSNLRVSSWNGTILQNWLNSTFINRAFTSNEQAFLCNVKETSFFRSSAFADSEKITILSYEQLTAFYPTQATRKCGDTGYWTRDIKTYSSYNSDVYYISTKGEKGSSEMPKQMGVRPAVVLNITNAVITRETEPETIDPSATATPKPTASPTPAPAYTVSVTTNNWTANTGWGQTLYCPNLQVKVTNNQSSSASRITVHVIFYDESEKSVWSDETSYLVSSSDSPLASGYSKTAYVTSSVGYTSKPSESRLATVKAEIYVNDVLYKTVNINKTFGN